jgi:predicted AlkP superfamily pyrophosphatase or phosphodiesterase
MRRIVLLLLLVVAPTVAVACQTVDEPILILMSFDGWRWDYQTKAPAPNLARVIARGVRAENLISSFPSKTFPNHYTIVTGLYPGHHGIVANTIRDAATGRIFSNTNAREQQDPMWWGGEPIWVTAGRAGRTTAAMFWPGSEALIGGVRPRYWKPYDAHYPAADRVDQVLQWLDLPSGQRPALIVLYFDDTDTAGHASGPESQAVREAIMRVDSYLGRLLVGLDARGLTDRVNLVVLSDHGMVGVSTERVAVADDYISASDAEIVDINPTLAVFPKPGKEDAVFHALEHAHPRLHVYRRNDTPSRWHYRDHPRIPPIMGVMDEGWQVFRRSTVEDFRAGRVRPPGGQHGYEPSLMSMRGLFVAAGPAFKQGITVPAFENIYIYNVLAKVLDVKPATNDGDDRLARAVLK